MNKVKWLVSGDHPIFKRPDKYFGIGEKHVAEAYASSIRGAGYTNVKVTYCRPKE